MSGDVHHRGAECTENGGGAAGDPDLGKLRAWVEEFTSPFFKATDGAWDVLCAAVKEGGAERFMGVHGLLVAGIEETSERARAFLAGKPAACTPAWRPMADAPRDESFVVAARVSSSPIVVWWDGAEHQLGEPTWVDSSTGESVEESSLVGWLPLPKAPAACPLCGESEICAECFADCEGDGSGGGT